MLFKDWKTNRELLWIAIGAAIMCIVSLVSYLGKFAGASVSNEPAAWGVFGDYIGGTLNPLLAVANICISIRIALLLNEISRKESKKQIKAQKQTTLIQVRNEVFRDFRYDFNKVFDQLERDAYHPPNFEQCVKVMEVFQESYHGLFDLGKDSSWSSIFHDLKQAEIASQLPGSTQDERKLKVNQHLKSAKFHKGAFYSAVLQKYFLT